MRKFYFLIGLFFVITPFLYAQKTFTDLNLMGKEALKLNKQEEAEKYFYQSIMRNKDTDSELQLARLYLAKRDSRIRNLGFEYISQAMLNEPDNLEVKYLYLDYLEYFGKRSKRLEEYWNIYNNDPTQAMAMFKIADIKFFEYDNYRALNVDTERWFLDEDVIPFDMTPLVKNQLDSAETFYLKGLEIDPKNHYGLFGIAKLYQSTSKPEKAIEYLKKITEYYPNDKDAHLQLAVYYYKKKKLDESFNELQKAITLMGAEEQEDFAFNSVIKLLEPKYNEPFRTMSDADKRTLIKKWWKASDPLYLSQYNERLMEHYARVAYANLFFSVPNIDVIGWKTDRGQVLIRYGDPARKEKIKQRMNLETDLKGIGLTKSNLSLNQARLNPNAGKYEVNIPEVNNTLGIPSTFIEIWEYDNIPGFVFAGDVNYYKFVTGNEMEELIRKRGSARSTSGIPSMLDSRSSINSLRDYESIKRQKIQGYLPVLYGRKVETGFKLYLFNKLTSGADGNVDAYVSYQIPQKDSTGNFVKDFTHEFGVYFFDQNFDPVIQVKDTLYEKDINTYFPSGTNEPVNSIGFGLKPRKVSFAFDLRRMIDSNYFTYRKTFEIPQPDNKSLSISDLVLTNNIELEKELPYGIKRGEMSFYPKVSNTFKNGEPFYIYYEVYNLKLDGKQEGDYEQVITLKPSGDEDSALKKIVKGVITIFTGEEGKVSLTSNYKTKEENTQVYMQIDLSGYKPGKYDLIITINDKISGKASEKKTDLEIL